MSTLLRNEAKQQEEAQAQINAANEIFKAVREWQSDPETASRRWPWELLQNALDSVAGQKRQIAISFTLEGDRLVVEHDGGIFQTEELVALLLGGTSKIQKSRPYTGRFGSGFLVTHAIATRVQVEGRVQTKTGEENFRVALERGGDVETIRGGIENNFVELESSIAEELPVARFTYEITRAEGFNVAKIGLQELSRLIPYVFAFAGQLASVCIHAQGELREFRKEDDYSLREHPHISACKIADNKGAPVHVISINPIGDDRAATIAFAAALSNGTWTVDHVGPLVPKLFCQYPLIETAGIGLPFVLNGAFEPDERRLSVFIGAGTLESEKNERLIERVLETVPSILAGLAGTGWSAVHRLADVTSSNDHESRRGWWDTKLRRLADTLCKTPLIEASPERAYLMPVDSAVPLSSFSTREAPGLVDRDLVLYLLKTIEQNVPAAAVAAEWEDIARHWKLLGCDRPRCYGLAELLDHLKKGTSLQEFSKLHGFETSDALSWITDLLDVVAAYEEAGHELPRSALDGVIPNQLGSFGSPRALAIDDDIPEQLKDVAKQVSLSLRAKLIDSAITAKERIRSLLERSGAGRILPDQAVEQIVGELQKKLLAGTRIDEEKPALQASVGLLISLNSFENDIARGFAVRVPLQTEDGEFALFDGKVWVFGPVSTWPSEVRVLRGVLNSKHWLSETYASQGPIVVENLRKWRIVLPSFFGWSDLTLEKEALEPILVGRYPEDGSHQFAAKVAVIPFINEMIGASGQNEDIARSFLHFLLDYIVRKDIGWKTPVKFLCKMHPGEVVEGYPSLWFSDLKRKRWVPMALGGDQLTPVRASQESLEPLIEWSSLGPNDPAWEFLERMGFPALNLSLRRLAGGSNEQLQAMEVSLSRLVSQLRSPEECENLVTQVAERRALAQKVERNKAFGLNIQDIVQQAFERANFKTVLIDRGYDFEAYLQQEVDAETDWLRFEITPFLVEVKATRDNIIRMSALQAKTAVATGEHYILCVVDCREGGLPADGNQFNPELVVPGLKIVRDIADRLKPIYGKSESVSTADIRVEIAGYIRYIVQRHVWEPGMGLPSWVASIRPDPEAAAPREPAP